MGDTKKIDISDVLKRAVEMYPALKAAAALEKTGIADAMSETQFVKFSDIKKAAMCSVSATCNFLAAAVKAGVVEKDPAGPNYRLNSYMAVRETAKRCLSPERIRKVTGESPIAQAERIVLSFIRYAPVFEALQNGELFLAEIQEQLSINQSPASLKMSLMYEYGWLDRRRDGKNVYYSLSDQTRNILASLAGALL